MAQENVRIIVKRIKTHGGGHHGGAWKIAYADFVTAMMAFFLLLWLLSTSSKSKLDGIAEFFTPTIGIVGKTEINKVYDPACGSERHMVPVKRPLSSLAAKTCFCNSVPWLISRLALPLVNGPQPMPTEAAEKNTLAADSTQNGIACRRARSSGRR